VCPRSAMAAALITVTLVLQHFYQYSPPGQNVTVSFCFCNKCGSSSFVAALYEAITGTEIRAAIAENPKMPRNPHNVLDWDIPGLAAARRPGDVHIGLVRDPISRYESAFRSKVMCCPNTTKPCFQDSSNPLAPRLTRVLGQPRKPCMGEHQYAQTLLQAKRQHLAGQLDPHFKPQHLVCPHGHRLPARTVALIGDAKTLGPTLRQVVQRAAFGNRTIDLKVEHATSPDHYYTFRWPATFRALCAVARDEYAVLPLPRHPRCAALDEQ